MEPVRKIILSTIIVISACLTPTASAYAAGFIVQWEPFIMDENLMPGNTEKEKFIKDSSLSDLKTLPSDNDTDTFDLSSNREMAPTQKTTKMSLINNIRINFSMADKLMKDKSQIYTDEEETLSKFIDVVTDLIYEDSKIKSMETLGKIIEPQINFYFEF